MSPPRRSPKPKLLLDEGLPPRRSFKALNRYCDVKHIRHDYKLGGAPDSIVYGLANDEQRVLVVFNVKDFKPMVSAGTMSVIGVSANMNSRDIDQKLTSLVKSMKPTDFQGKYKRLA